MAKSREQYIAENTDDYEGDLYAFALVDRHTVERLQKDGDITLPYKDLDKIKDERWNTKLFTSRLLQGILNGDPIPNIAARLLDVVGYNESAAMRNARTMTTACENRGRQDSYEELADNGVVQKKVWIATPDDRTRASHLEIDGEEVDIDAEFSNKLKYPADPDGAESEVYNCRCSMRDHIVGFRKADGRIQYIGRERDETMHAEQIAQEREARGVEPQEKAEEKTEKPQVSFTPAQTIAEAEEYARQNFVVQTTWSDNGNVSYKGMSIENANEINKELTNLFAQNDLPRFNNIGMMNFRQKIWKDAKDAPMAYRAMFNGELYFNPTVLKDAKSLESYMKKGQEAFDFCINNMDRFTGKQLDLVKQYKEAGRQTVADSSDNPIKAMLDHEVGHHIDHQIIMRNKEFTQITKDGMDEYGIKLSGYALHTRGEYVAESFCAYTNGLGDIDPELAKIFDGVRK